MQDDYLNREQEREEAVALAAANALEQRVIRALEAAPEMLIPADFAARVARRLPGPRPSTVTATRYGYHAILISMVVLLAVLLALAARTAPHSTLGLTMLWLVFGQFTVLAVWFSGWRRSLR